MQFRKKFIIILLFNAFLLVNALLTKASGSDYSDSLQCLKAIQYFEKKYNIPSNYLYLIDLVESGRWDEKLKMLQPWPWTLNVNGEAKFFNNKRDMLVSLKKYIAGGETRIDIGCSQINYKYHKSQFNNLEQMINPHYNVEYSARYLAKVLFKKTKNWSEAVALYHSHNPIHNTQYIKRIQKKVKNSGNLQLALNSTRNNKFDVYRSQSYSKSNLTKSSRADIMVYNAHNNVSNHTVIH